MMLVELSPTRYAACVRSGETPSCISIGTMMAPMSAHFAEAEPMSRFTVAVSRMMPVSVTPSGSAASRSAFAPFSASSAPRFDWPKA